jgi:hypothetical protein
MSEGWWFPTMGEWEICRKQFQCLLFLDQIAGPPANMAEYASWMADYVRVCDTAQFKCADFPWSWSDNNPNNNKQRAQHILLLAAKGTQRFKLVNDRAAEVLKISGETTGNLFVIPQSGPNLPKVGTSRAAPKVNPEYLDVGSSNEVMSIDVVPLCRLQMLLFCW